MAKEKKGLTFGRFLMTAAVLLAGCVSAFTIVQIKANTNGDNIIANKTEAVAAIAHVEKEAKETIGKLEIDGCKPAQKHGADMKVVEYRLNSIDKGMGEFREESKQQFEAIMKKL